MFFFFNDTATTEIYTLSLHDALPILLAQGPAAHLVIATHSGPMRAFASAALGDDLGEPHNAEDRKSTRLNSSHANISYAVFCLKKKKLTSSVFHLSTLPLNIYYLSFS